MYFNLVAGCTIDTTCQRVGFCRVSGTAALPLYYISTVRIYVYTIPTNFMKKHLWIAPWCCHRMPCPKILQRKLLRIATKSRNSPNFSPQNFLLYALSFLEKTVYEYKWYKLVEILLYQREGEGCVLVWLAEMLNFFREVMIETSQFWHDLCVS